MMLSVLRNRWKEQFAEWVLRNHPPTTERITISRRRVYILPTRYGYYFAVVLMLMLIGAINYQNSLSYMLTFLLVGIGSNAMWHTNRNLVNITAQLKSPSELFAGQAGFIPLTLHNPDKRTRYDIVAEHGDQTFVRGMIASHDTSTMNVPLIFKQRGIHPIKRIRVYTRYPLGLFQAWTWLNFDYQITVYPKPIEKQSDFSIAAESLNTGQEQTSGNDDFSNLREYQKTDSPKHVAWKKVAHNDQWLTKEFEGEAGGEIELNWDDIPTNNPEEKLSVLCAWVLRSEKENLKYGLSIPGKYIDANRGFEHRKNCLRALAAWQA